MVTGKSQWQAQFRPNHRKTRTQTLAHQPNRYDFQDYLFKLTVEENGTISSEGMNKEHEKFFYVTVHVRTISGKTISIKCDKRQSITRIKDQISRKTKIPKDLQHLVNQGRALSEHEDCGRKQYKR